MPSAKTLALGNFGGRVPTYQYACTECGDRLEVVQRFSDDPLTVCAACGGKLRKVFSPVGIVFKGSGFYRTDSRSTAGAASSNGKSNGEGSSTSDSGTDSGKKAESGSKASSESSSSSSSSSSSNGSSSGGDGSGKKNAASTGSSGTSSKVA
jgi:putative FmdB family regulatory protein